MSITERKFHLVGSDWPETINWANEHEINRLWEVTVTDAHVMPTLRATLYRTLDDALKNSFEMSGVTIGWFRREIDAFNEPFIALRIEGTTDPVAYITPAYLAFTLPFLPLAKSMESERLIERTTREQLIDAACTAEEQLGVDECERYANEQRAKRARDNASNDYI